LENYWCDLMCERAANGDSNTAAAATGRAAFLALAGCLLACWPVAASLAGDRRLARWARASGVLAAAAVVVFAVLPFDTQPRLHAVATLAAGVSGLAAILLLLIGELERAPRLGWRHVWGAGLVVIGGVNAALYIVCVVSDVPSVVLPVVQKAGSLFLVLWVVTTLLAALRPRTAATSPASGQ
jgi:hypothetical protein